VTTVQESEEHAQLVPLRVVDGIAGRDDEVDLGSAGRPLPQGVERTDHRLSGARDQRLLWSVHRNELVEPGIVHVLVAELEPRGRLHVDQLQVGGVREDEERAPLPWRAVTGAMGQVRAHNSGLTWPEGDGPVGALRAGAQDRPGDQRLVQREQHRATVTLR
jgi:hypothetical protein